MSVTRRSFLVGIGSIITMSFVHKAKAHLAGTGEPFLEPPALPVQDLYYEESDSDGWRLHLGDPQTFAPEPPRLIDFLRSQGKRLETPRQIGIYCEREYLSEGDLHEQVDGFAWEDYWEANLSSDSRAYHFLKSGKIFPRIAGYASEGGIVFDSRPNPMSSVHYVEVRDELSLSLLQARLNELELRTAVKLLRWPS